MRTPHYPFYRSIRSNGDTVTVSLRILSTQRVIVRYTVTVDRMFLRIWGCAVQILPLLVVREAYGIRLLLSVRHVYVRLEAYRVVSASSQYPF